MSAASGSGSTRQDFQRQRYLLYDCLLSQSNSTQCFAFDCWYTPKYELVGTGISVARVGLVDWLQFHWSFGSLGIDRLLKHKWSSPSMLSHHRQEFFSLQAAGEKEFWQPNPPKDTTCTATSEAISV